jgi:hypothetical protein
MRKLLIITLVLILASCDGKTKNFNNQIRDDVFGIIDSYVPKMINKKNYIFVYRSGSIEYASDYSLLCIPKKELFNKKINCFYLMLNNIDDIKYMGRNFNEGEPKAIIYNFDLINNKKMKLSKLNKLKKEKLRNYRMKISRKGEGHRNNFYYISCDENNFVYVLDFTSSLNEKLYFQSLFQQISSSEYLQAFSMNKVCDEKNYLIQKLKKNEDLDTFKFRITNVW